MIRRSFAAVLAVGVLLPTAAFAQQPTAKTPALPDGTQAQRNLRYGPHEERNVLDLYVPKSDQPLPLVVWVHGGGWQNGSKDGQNPALPLLKKGYAVASVNYRLSQHAVFPAQIEDCKAAVRYLRANAAKYNLNPDTIGVWGASAGGHLVALLGTSGGEKDLEGDGDHKDVSSRVQAVCDYYGPTDFTRMPGNPSDANGALAKLFGGSVAEKKALAAQASPTTYVSKDDPPFLILHGDKDPLVPVAQSELLADTLRKAGVDVTLVVVPGGAHNQKVGEGENADKIVAFFDKHLKRK